MDRQMWPPNMLNSHKLNSQDPLKRIGWALFFGEVTNGVFKDDWKKFKATWNDLTACQQVVALYSIVREPDFEMINNPKHPAIEYINSFIADTSLDWKDEKIRLAFSFLVTVQIEYMGKRPSPPIIGADLTLYKEFLLQLLAYHIYSVAMTHQGNYHGDWNEVRADIDSILSLQQTLPRPQLKCLKT